MTSKYQGADNANLDPSPDTATVGESAVAEQSALSAIERAELKRLNVPEHLHRFVGTVWHFLPTYSIPLNGRPITRGHVVMWTARDLASTLNSARESYVSDLESEEAQWARWGEVRFAPGTLPDDFQKLLPGTVSWAIHKRDALNDAFALPPGPARENALAVAQEKFGGGDPRDTTYGRIYEINPTGGRA